MKVLWRNGLFTDSGFTQNGFLQGEGIFETLRCEGNRIFALNRHMRRAISIGNKYGISIPHEDDIMHGLSSVMERAEFSVARLRLLFASENFAISYEPYREASAGCALEIGNLSSHQSRTEKTFPYDDRLNLLSKVQEKGFDEIALVTQDGFITEGAVSNLIFRDSKGWFTPPLSFGVLPGVMRALYVDHMDIQVRPVSVEELQQVTAGFAISSLRLAQPVTRIGERELSIDHESEAMAQSMRQVAVDSSVVLAHG